MERLKRLASYTKGSKVVCDIGCDHAYALIYAIQNYGVEQGIAADIALGPLDNAKKTIQSAHLEQKIKTIQSDGFTALGEEEFDTAILAGMGGILMRSILERGYEKISSKTLILEANCDTYLVREFLYTHGFIIQDEDALYEDGKYYEIVVARPGKASFDVLDITYGPILRKKRPEAFLKYLRRKQELLLSIIDNVKDESKKEEKRKEYFEITFLFKEINMEKHYIENTINYYRTYFLDNQKRPTILIAPGGGYKYTSIRESEPVVEEFLKRGYHAVVINYRETVNDPYPLPQQYLAKAINKVSLDPRVKELIGLGFSAGGHCILEVCLHKEEYQTKGLDLLMLAYPVVSSDPQIAHMGSFQNLLFEKANDPALRNRLSLEKEVTSKNAIDLFLWGTITDESVSVLNSLRLIDAYHKALGNVEYHLFPFGPHGLSVANKASSQGKENLESSYLARWVDLADEWIKNKLK